MIPFIAALAVAVTLPATSSDSLAARIEARVAEVPGAQVGLAYHKLGSGDSLYMNADTSLHAASSHVDGYCGQSSSSSSS